MEYFTTFGIKDLIDVISVAFLLFWIYKLMKRSGSLNMFVGIVTFLLIWMVVSQMLKMQLLGAILDKLIDVGVIALIVLFAEDLRQFFRQLGTKARSNSLFTWLTKRSRVATADATVWQPLVQACVNMSQKKQGALIVIKDQTSLDGVVQIGEKIDADMNQLLIENIFFKNSPLHDGAMVINDLRIESAACILPVSHAENLPKSFGLRHRAAMGLTEDTDAMAIVVSEETGGVSIFRKGKYRKDLEKGSLSHYLMHPDEI